MIARAVYNMSRLGLYSVVFESKMARPTMVNLDLTPCYYALELFILRQRGPSMAPRRQSVLAG